MKEIAEYLDEIEKTHDIKILYAIESGSRAWGFASPDSDYDVRFIYARRPMDYFSLSGRVDVLDSNNMDVNMEFPYDFAGWDIHKALHLMLKGNATVQEWLNSPIVYRSINPGFIQAFRSLSTHHFNPKAAFHHYRGMAKVDFKAENLTLKKLLYTMRCTEAALWSGFWCKAPPVDMYELCEHSVSAILIGDHVGAKEVFQSLKELKTISPEKKYISVDDFPKEYEVIKRHYDYMEEVDFTFISPLETLPPLPPLMNVDQFLKYSIFVV